MEMVGMNVRQRSEEISEMFLAHAAVAKTGVGGAACKFVSDCATLASTCPTIFYHTLTPTFSRTTYSIMALQSSGR
jgi:hypothetical protein